MPVELLIIGGFVAFWLLAVSALVSAARIPPYVYEHDERGKPGTLLCLLLTGGVGGAYYWLSVRPSLREAEAELAPRPRPAARPVADG